MGRTRDGVAGPSRFMACALLDRSSSDDVILFFWGFACERKQSMASISDDGHAILGLRLRTNAVNGVNLVTGMLPSIAAAQEYLRCPHQSVL